MKFLVLVPIYRRYSVLRLFNEGLEMREIRIIGREFKVN